MPRSDKNKRRARDERSFALRALGNYEAYRHLAEGERNEHLRLLFEELSRVAREQFNFWSQKTGVRGDELKRGKSKFIWYSFLRFMLGATLMAKFMIERERVALLRFDVYCVDCINEEERRMVTAFIERSLALIHAEKDRRYEFFSYIVLGFNDALIELTGALIGFSLALRDPTLVSIAGLITGVSAAGSMASSAYLQAAHEDGRDPLIAAGFTGISYLLIAVALVLPFIFLPSLPLSIGAMLTIVLILVSVISFYSSILLGKSYPRQLRQILFLSLGVALLSFTFGYILNYFFLPE